MSVLPVENSLYKIVVSLGLLILTIFLIKTILSSCYFSPFRSDCKNNNEEMLEKAQTLENENRILEEKLNNYKIELAKINCTKKEEIEIVNNNETQKIDEEKWEKGDLSLLDGCWDLTSDDYVLIQRETNEEFSVKNWTMCFEENNEGLGIQNLSYTNGTSCKNQKIKGIFDLENKPVKLYLDDLNNVDCSDRSYIYRRKFNCVLNQNAQFAECNNNSQYINGKWVETSSKVIFKKAN